MNELMEIVGRSIAVTPDGMRSVFDPAAVPWTAKVESHWKAIRAELDSLLEDIDSLPGFEEIQVEQESLSTDRRWKIFPFCAYGTWTAYPAHRCPRTVEALRLIPGLQAAMFSIFHARKEVPPHEGPYKGVLRYHLGLKVPQPETLCGIEVGGDVRHWSEGKSMIFDDSITHRAWNHSDESRVVLFVDFTRPLPSPLNEVNENVIAHLGENDFVRLAVERWRRWESAHWPELSAPR